MYRIRLQLDLSPHNPLTWNDTWISIIKAVVKIKKKEETFWEEFWGDFREKGAFEDYFRDSSSFTRLHKDALQHKFRSSRVYIQNFIFFTVFMVFQSSFRRGQEGSKIIHVLNWYWFVYGFVGAKFSQCS